MADILILIFVSAVLIWFLLTLVAYGRITRKVGGWTSACQVLPFVNMLYYFQLSGVAWKYFFIYLVISIALPFLLGATEALSWFSMRIYVMLDFVDWVKIVFINLFNIAAWLIVHIKIAERCGSTRWMGVLAGIPFVDLWALWRFGSGPKKVPVVVLPENFSPADVAKSTPESEPVPEPVAHLQPADVPVELTAHEQEQVVWIKQCVAGGFEKSQLQQTLAEQSQVTPEQFEKLWTAAQ